MSEEKGNEVVGALHKMFLFQKNVFDVQELCLYTGFSSSAIYKMTSKNEIPYSQPMGRKLFFNREEIDKWLLGKPNRTREALKDEASSFTIKRKRSA
jgi:excisionase family DNA binding protein